MERDTQLQAAIDVLERWYDRTRGHDFDPGPTRITFEFRARDAGPRQLVMTATKSTEL